MATRRLNLILERLRSMSGRGSVGKLHDRVLLERFITRGDEAAFRTLLHRHGPMVLDVCRRVLHDRSAADDVFQATFLVLARKAASVRKRELLASWLYGVAYRTAARANVEAAKRRARESAVGPSPAADPIDDMTVRELFAATHEELARLPEQYRAPLILCYLESRTRDEAADALGCSLATLDRRLQRGRAYLKARLARRGLSLGIALLPTMLAHSSAHALTPTLAASTTQAAIALATGQTTAAGVAVSAHAAALSQGVINAMCLTKIKCTAALILTVGLAVSGAGALSYGLGTHEPHAVPDQPARLANPWVDLGRTERPRQLANPWGILPAQIQPESSKAAAQAPAQPKQPRAQNADPHVVHPKNQCATCHQPPFDDWGLHPARRPLEDAQLRVHLADLELQAAQRRLDAARRDYQKWEVDQKKQPQTPKKEPKTESRGAPKQPAAARETLLDQQRDRQLIEEQRLERIVVADIAEARRLHKDDPHRAVAILRAALLQIWDHPELSDRARASLLPRVLEARREMGAER